jgi:hypothetical protein
MRPKSITSVVGVLLTAGTCLAQDIHPNAGTTAFPFLTMGYDARAIAMGGAAVAVPNDLAGVVANPAAIAWMERRQLMVGYRPVLVDQSVMGTPIAFGARLHDHASPRPANYGVLAGSVLFMSGGTINETNELGVTTGEVWRDYSLAGQLSWARVIWETLAAGITLKAMHHRMENGHEYYSLQGFAVDAGAQYRLAKDHFICAIAVRNLGFTVTGKNPDNTNPPLARAATIGFSFQPKYASELRLALDFDKAYDNYLNMKGGVEVDVFREILFARIGYALTSQDIQVRLRMLRDGPSDTEVKNDWYSVGFGVGVRAPVKTTNLGIDVAYQFRTLGMSPAFALSATAGF